MRDRIEVVRYYLGEAWNWLTWPILVWLHACAKCGYRPSAVCRYNFQGPGSREWLCWGCTDLRPENFE